MVAGSASVLRKAIPIVRRALGELGFSAKGMTFHRTTQEGNAILLSIQKSAKSTPTRCAVTINYGVHCALIASRLQQRSAQPADVMEAHWRERLNEAGREKWLWIEATDTPASAARTILAAVDAVMAELLAHSTNVALRDEWLAGCSPGLSEMERLLFTAVLVNEFGPVDRLGEMVGGLRNLVAGGIHEGLVERHLARAGIIT